MPRIIEYYVAVSLDGFIAREDGSFAEFAPDETQLGLFQQRIQTHYDAVVMGRSTFEVGLAHGVNDPYPWLDTHVVSRTLEPSTAPAVSVHRDGPEATARRLRASDGGVVWLCGGGRLAGALMDAGLVDRLVLKRYPVVLGQGIPLFDRSVRNGLIRTDAQIYDSGHTVEFYDVTPT